jgi:serine/threonine-protein kinase
MPLTAGTRLGPYEVATLLGEGGMGQVYRSRDTKLGRDVALKVLPPLVANDPDRLARFRREAHVLASLNDPHIAQIYGFEDAGGTHALVMELVDGPTLADRIASGPLPLTDALAIAQQIASALETAHEQGVVHRDLKPANVKVREDDTVKVLDFGLAKAFEPTGESSIDAANSPTITTPAMTEQGMILGTAAYMSPEQARGRPVDKRADIWAFGVVLFEMLTGRRLYDGETVSDTLAAVLRQEIDWRALPADTPPAVRRLVTRCLDRDPRQRLRDIGEARVLLSSPSDVAATVSDPARPAPAARGFTWRRALIAGGALVVASAIAMAGYAGGRHGAAAPVTSPPSYFDLPLAPAAALGPGGLFRRPSGPTFVLTRDGRRIVFTGTTGDPAGTTQLYVRDLGQPIATPIAGTDGAANPFLSPDEAWIGFFAGGRIRRVPIGGGAVVTIADLTTGTQPAPNTLVPPAYDFYGATWGRDGTIVFGRFRDGLWQVPASGGTASRLIAPPAGDDRAYRLPRALPDGGGVLFTIVTPFGTGLDRSEIAVLPRGETTPRILVKDGADARYSPSGHLVFVRHGTLMGIRFDLTRLTVTGEPVALIEGVQHASGSGAPGANSQAGQFDLADSGTLVFATGGLYPATPSRLGWISRTGQVEPLTSPAGEYVVPRLSPDGSRIAVTYYPASASREDGGIFILDLARGSFRRIAGADAWGPKWSHDGAGVYFRLPRGLGIAPADGSGPPDVRFDSPAPAFPSAISPDGSTLVFLTGSPASGSDIWTLALGGDRSAKPWLQTSATEAWPDLSPDGRWMAYGSDSSGKTEVYVRPFPGPGSPQQVSVDGGDSARWSRDGREIFYHVRRVVDGQSVACMMAVDVTITATVTAGRPHQLFCGNYMTVGGPTGYDLSKDGRRFLMVQFLDQPKQPITHLSVITNWTEMLRQQVR